MKPCLLFAMLLFASGCAVGKAPNGKYVIGLGVSDSGAIEAPVDQIAEAGAMFGIPEALTSGMLGLLGLGGAAYGVRRGSEAAERRGAERGWDEAVNATYVQRANSVGGRA